MVNAMELNTKRLTLRPWKESDAKACVYMYAKESSRRSKSRLGST